MLLEDIGKKSTIKQALPTASKVTLFGRSFAVARDTSTGKSRSPESVYGGSWPLTTEKTMCVLGETGGEG